MGPPVSGEQRIGSYLLLRRLGEGGMGVVWLARDEQLDRDIAIKQMSIPQGSSARAMQRFVREARSAAKLNHVNCLSVYHLIEEESSLYIVMEYAGGGSLADRIGRGPMPWREATRAIVAAAEGLGAAHAAGLVHRDIKPSNLLLSTTGVVKVADFGLARSTGLAGEVTLKGAMVGTPAYMAPEQCRGESVDAKTDLYALGCTWFALLTGRSPFEGVNVAALVYQQMNTPVPEVSKLVSDLPAEIDAIIQKATRKNPAERHASAAELIAEIESAIGPTGERTVIVPAGASPRESRGAASGPTPAVVSSPSRSPVPTNLPQESSTFVGRESELKLGAQLLAESRLVTLTGAGGTGKTRLSLKLARNALNNHPDGVWWVELAPLANGELVLPTLAETVMQAPLTPEQSISEGLIDFIADKSLLIVFDNCEHVIDEVARLSTLLLASCANLRVLASSRQPLSIDGEQTMRVPSLGVPESAYVKDATSVEAIDAVKLFVDRARSANSSFRLVDANATHVAEICRRLDGIPLAIELAAARIKVLSPQQIAQRLDDRFKLLISNSRSALPRQQTLRALVDWSFELLNAQEKVFFTRLGVFVGSFSLEAAETVCADETIDAAFVLDLLASLVDKSLVLMDEVKGDTRYRMLETLRQYATDRMNVDPSQTRLFSERHAAWAVQYAADADERLDSAPDQARLLQSWDREVDNMRVAIDFLIASDRGDAAVKLVMHLSTYWLRRGALREGLVRVHQVMNMASAALSSENGAMLLARSSVLARERGEMSLAQALGVRGLELGRKVGSQRVVGYAANALGNVYRCIERTADAQTCYEEASGIWRELGEDRPLGRVLSNLSLMAMERGNVVASRAYLEEARAIFEKHADRVMIATVRLNVADLLLYAGNVEESLDESLAVEKLAAAAHAVFPLDVTRSPC